jgi:hypothetical protein
MICLIAKLGRNLTMSGDDFGRSMNLLPVAGVVRRDLRCLRPAEAAPGDGFLDLLAARAGRFKVFGGVSLTMSKSICLRSKTFMLSLVNCALSSRIAPWGSRGIRARAERMPVFDRAPSSTIT